MDAFKLFAGIPWVITHDALQAAVEIAPSRLAATYRPGAMTADGQAAPAQVTKGTAAIIPIRGTLQQHGANDFWSILFGEGTSMDALEANIRAALADPQINSLVLDIDSPGGSANGVASLCAFIRSSRGGSKPIVGVANSSANSGAYWIGASCDAFYGIPGAMVGSIGVYALHMDVSEAMAAQGVKPSFISAGKFKVEGNPYEPLTDEARAHMQSIIDDTYQAFVEGVAQGRGVSASVVRKTYGEGRVLTAKVAKSLGMIDGILTMEQAVKRSLNMKSRAPGAAADDDEPEAEQAAEHADDVRVDGDLDEARHRLRVERLRGEQALAAAVIGGK